MRAQKGFIRSRAAAAYTKCSLLFLFFVGTVCGMAEAATPPATLGDDVSAVRADIDFVTYLMGRGEFRESLYLLEKIQTGEASLKDTVRYYQGWIQYQQMELESSAGYFLAVSQDSPLFYKSRFFGAYSLAHVGNLAEARHALKKMGDLEEELYMDLLQLQYGGLDLLAGSLDEFSRRSASFTGRFHALAAEEGRMKDHHETLASYTPKRPVVAGMLSAVVPGLGKVYAGKTAEGVVSFLYVSALGLTAWDFYRGAGPQSALFILSAAVAGVFYAGNIKGSAVAARRVNQEFYHEMEQRILFDMHIPLRNAFR